MDPLLPEKNFFRIGEVSKITGLKPHVLRYWETEFKMIRPLKTRSQQRIYQKRDVELIIKIKRLLYDKKFTIEGARQILKREIDNKRKEDKAPKSKLKETLDNLKEELTDIKDILK